jgi:hypothetical protein
MNEPKPHTPLTDTVESEAIRQFAQGQSWRGVLRYVCGESRSLELKLQEAERQRDGANEHLDSTNISCDRAEAERDQLIKVVDDAVTSLQEAADTYDEEGFNNAHFLMALTAYSLLSSRRKETKTNDTRRTMV